MNTDKFMLYETRKAKPTTIWLLFLLLGWSYGSLDKIGLQILYYVTLAGCGFWLLVRLFTLNGAIKEYNRKIAAQVGLDNQEMSSLGLF
ncbi:TM2 domain-containing protein [Psychroflexus maritimus]|uniref:TM2 domain-containing protein n=1 Tax=Psychroflexus maritimus TaxID=2714865 RepID=A0A967DZX2_9FLAO|nr:TM2 domain-containing protein [Psychroflexus maritimus]NGZ89992.1 TM2 domain-containing protein [Psychroflexus maritimus]